MFYANWSIKKRILIVVLALIGLVLLVFLNPPSGKPGGPQSRQMFTPGPLQVVTEPFKVVDSSRPMEANDEFDGDDERPLEGKLWRPAEAGSYPFLVYSHGFMSQYWEGGYINEFLASHGYIVVAVDYPLTNFFAPGGPYLADVVNQPGDVSFIMDKVLERNSKEGDSLYQQIDENRIGVLGLSLGGMTTTMVTFDGRMKDPRIKAAVSIAGPSSMFTEKFFSHNDVPFMMIGGTSDQLVPYELNARPILEKDPDSILVSLELGSHGAFAGVAAYLMRFARHPDEMACNAIRDNVNRVENPIASIISDEYGVTDMERKRFCDELGDLPKAMRASQQHMLTTLSVFSFFESHFNQDKKQRIKHLNFLINTFPEENNDVKVDINS